MNLIVAAGILVLVCTPILRWIDQRPENSKFLHTLFVRALAIRVALGLVIYMFNLQDFFGGGAGQYHFAGTELMRNWSSGAPMSRWTQGRLSTEISGWGMYYWVGVIYFVVGPNMLVAQFLNATLGSLVPLLLYFISETVFRHRKVSERAATLVAFFPSIVLWSSQMLKDPLILLCICVVVYSTLQLKTRLSSGLMIAIGVSLFALYSLRYYVFYIMVLSLVVSAVLNSVRTSGGFARQAAGLTLAIGLFLYLGVGDQAAEHYEKLDLDTIQSSRAYLSSAANSGFGGDIDIRSPGGIEYAMTVGITYLLFAPFPWQMTNLRQLITLPEMLVWWSMFPFLISGIWYGLRYRLADCSAILFFLLTLMIAYSVFLANVGTAYRQRAQLLVFLLLFVSVGITLREQRQQHKASRAGLPGRPVPSPNY